MFAPKNILIPTDYSECSEKAMEAAIEIAECYNAKLHIIHVIINEIEQMPFLRLSSDRLTDLAQKIQDNATSEMHYFVNKYIGSRPVDYQTYIVNGVPYEEILKLTEDINADLIVISPKGKSAIEGFLFGSTTNRVVHKAPCDVLVTKRL